MGPSTLIDGDPREPRRLVRPEEASMGPSTLIDGDTSSSSRWTKRSNSLQWGRRLSSTETQRMSLGAAGRHASMGPSTLIDGDSGWMAFSSLG